MESLVCFLYVLMRDEVTLGEIEAIMKGHVAVAQQMTGPTIYSNKYLEAYARSLAERILD